MIKGTQPIKATKIPVEIFKLFDQGAENERFTGSYYTIIHTSLLPGCKRLTDSR